jgi:hypothetical protein
MAQYLSLSLQALHCYAALQAIDEVYLLLDGGYLDGSRKLHCRLPEQGCWSFQHGDHLTLAEPAELFSGPIGMGVQFRLALAERNVHGEARHLNQLEFYFGELKLRALGSDQCELEAGHHALPCTNGQNGQLAAYQHFDLKGSSAHYRITLCFETTEQAPASA